MPLRIQPQIQLQSTATEHVMMITGRGTPTHTLIELIGPDESPLI